ncbi:MAG: division/cell wall cluster transcriptional repressor MraZ [Planctomycetota bacterium]
MPLFVGEFEQTIDDKNRVSISASLRELVNPEEDGSNFILILGPDKHLWLYPDKYYQRLVGSMKRSALPTREARKIDLWFAMARLLKPDSQGRVVLPEKSMQRAEIDKKITVIGNNDHIEVWPTDEYERRVAEELPTLGEALYEAAERLSDQTAGD